MTTADVINTALASLDSLAAHTDPTVAALVEQRNSLMVQLAEVEGKIAAVESSDQQTAKRVAQFLRDRLTKLPGVAP